MSFAVVVIEVKPVGDLFNYLIQDASIEDPQPWRENRTLMQLVRDGLESYLIDAEEDLVDWDSNARSYFLLAVESLIETMEPYASSQFIHSVIPIDTKGTLVLITQFHHPR